MEATLCYLGPFATGRAEKLHVARHSGPLNLVEAAARARRTAAMFPAFKPQGRSSAPLPRRPPSVPSC